MKKLMIYTLSIALLMGGADLFGRRSAFGGTKGKKERKGRKFEDDIIDNDVAAITQRFTKKDGSIDTKKVANFDKKRVWTKGGASRSSYDSPVTLAAGEGKSAALNELLRLGFPVRGNALQKLIEAGNSNITDDVISKFKSSANIGALNAAVERGQYDASFIQKIINAGANPDISTLNIAIEKNRNIEVVKMLMANGVAPDFAVFKNAITRDWKSIKYDVVAALVDAGALESNAGNVKLADGALGNDQLVGTLFSVNRTVTVNPNLLVEANGHDLLWHAANKNDLWLLCYLIGYDISGKVEGSNPSYTFNQVPDMAGTKNVRIIAPVDQLPNFKSLEQTMSVTKKYPGNDKGKTALMIAIYYNKDQTYLAKSAKDMWGATADKPGVAVNQKIIKALLDTFIATPGVDLNMKDNDGNTTLEWIVKNPLTYGGFIDQQVSPPLPGDFAQTLQDAMGIIPQ